MSGRIRSIAGHRRAILTSGWELGRATSAGSPAWSAIEALGTVADALRACGAWSLDAAAQRFDGTDWWYRSHFDAPPGAAAAQTVLGFDGLATVADVWLNGELILHSDNMFLEHEVALQNLRARNNELLLRFHSLDALLTARRPRPRWRTPMVENQQLRWFRTTLLGRTPGWSPPAAAVGPWRPIWIETREFIDVSHFALRSELQGTTGIVEVECVLTAFDKREIARVDLILARGAERYRTTLALRTGATSYAGRLELPHVTPWWPHTHGEPALYEVSLQVMGSGTESVMIDAGHTGFRRLALDQRDGAFELRVNDVPIFCRGACWTPLDCVSLRCEEPDVSIAIRQARAAGMNMLRVGGTMVYESQAFLDACDTQGMLVWQDFMFANMDYPEDEDFAASVAAECRAAVAALIGPALPHRIVWQQ